MSDEKLPKLVREVRKNGSLRIRTMFREKTKTQQHFADSCDVNKLMKKYKNINAIPMEHFKNHGRGVYGDFSNIGDYHSAFSAVASAQEAFMKLDANIRKRFHNDPQELLDFVNDDRNYDEAVSLGIIPKKTLQSDPNLPKAGEVTPTPKKKKTTTTVVEED